MEKRIARREWPLPRELMTLRLLAAVFPVTDRRHPVLTPAGLLVGQALSSCPLGSGAEVARALYLAGLLAHMHAGAARFVPEAVVAVRGALSVLPALLGRAGAGDPGPLDARLSLADAFAPTPAEREQERRDAVERGEAPPRDGSPSPEADDAALLGRCLAGAAALASRLVATHAGLPCAAEVADSLADALRRAADAVGPRAGGRLRALAGEATAAARAAEGRRMPLVQRFRLEREGRRTLNPRFEEDFALGKSYDPDAERAQLKTLKRQFAKEKRAVSRELRKDAAFMHAVREREVAGRDVERIAGQKRAFHLLQQQEADMRSGGQGGMWKKKKKGK